MILYCVISRVPFPHTALHPPLRTYKNDCVVQPGVRMFTFPPTINIVTKIQICAQQISIGYNQDENILCDKRKNP